MCRRCWHSIDRYIKKEELGLNKSLKMKSGKDNHGKFYLRAEYWPGHWDNSWRNILGKFCALVRYTLVRDCGCSSFSLLKRKVCHLNNFNYNFIICFITELADAVLFNHITFINNYCCLCASNTIFLKNLFLLFLCLMYYV